MGAGLRPKAKGLDKPPDPTVRAPVLDPTLGGWGAAMLPGYPARFDSLITKGLAAYLIARQLCRVPMGEGRRGAVTNIWVPPSSISRSSRRGVSLRLQLELLRFGAVSPCTRPDSYRKQE